MYRLTTIALAACLIGHAALAQNTIVSAASTPTGSIAAGAKLTAAIAVNLAVAEKAWAVGYTLVGPDGAPLCVYSQGGNFAAGPSHKTWPGCTIPAAAGAGTAHETWTLVDSTGTVQASVRATIAITAAASTSPASPPTPPSNPPPTSTTPAGVQVPGPSAALFANPYYSCVRNLYISTTGRDGADGSQATPWATLQHANDAGRAAGDCVNIAPGIYAGVNITKGGNLAASSGYVVYRCQSLDACTINATAGANGNSGFIFDETVKPMAGFVMIDGFTIAGNTSNTSFGQGINLFHENTAFSSSHVWVLNSIIANNGQSGVQMNDGHNNVVGNSNWECGAQGSGISFASLKAAAGYKSTSDDATNPNPLIGTLGPFHNAVEWNVVTNNALTHCGTASNPFDTDGNGIIMDSFSTDNGNTVNYPSQTLVAFNVTYNNGGGGVHVFESELVTVANNTCYNNYLDLANHASGRACIDTLGSFGDTVINNITVSIASPNAVPSSCFPGGMVTTPYSIYANAIFGSPPSSKSQSDAFMHNITRVLGNSCQGEVQADAPDSYSAITNLQATDPMWVDVGTKSTGSETTQPSGANFALRSGSPAIGYGIAESYLPAQSVDAGACSSTLTTCP